MVQESLVIAADSGKRARRGALIAFLKAVVASPPAGCVLWPYAKDSGGYGQVRYAGQKVGAHRLAWELYHGKKMASGSHAAHTPITCNNKACVNPLHVREASPAENAGDRVLDGSDNRGRKHGQSKLTERQVLAIRSDARLLREIAQEHGVCDVTICDIKAGRTWSWL